jgi:hypothetical protein
MEFTIHTLALHKQLSVIKAKELLGVVYRKEWDVSEINSETTYHPLKDRDSHSRYRKIINQNSSMAPRQRHILSNEKIARKLGIKHGTRQNSPSVTSW